MAAKHRKSRCSKGFQIIKYIVQRIPSSENNDLKNINMNYARISKITYEKNCFRLKVQTVV